MRRIIAFNHVSADGFFADRHGTLDWVVSEDALEAHGLSNMAHSDTILFGRRTYELFEAYWPQALNDPEGAKDPHGERGRRTPGTQRIAEWINTATKLVVSRTRTGDTLTWANSHQVVDAAPATIQSIKQQPGTDILLFGSSTLASTLAGHRLIDEYQFGIVPVVLGDGRSWLAASAMQKLTLIENRPLPEGTVLLRYSAQR